MSGYSIVAVDASNGQPITVVWTATPVSVAGAKIISVGGAVTPPVSGGGSGPPSGGAGGVLSGTYPNPGFASDMAYQSELNAHINANNPHPNLYDDLPSLKLLYESKLV